MKQNEIISKFKLPSYIQGKSFAEASKAINKKFEGRNDMISKTTKEELLTRLANAQEYVKAQSEPDPLTNNTFEGGGFMSPEFFEKNPEFGNQAMNMTNGLNTIINPSGTYGKQQVENEKVGFYDEKLTQDQSIEQNVNMAQDAVASAFGPIGQAVRAGQKLGKGIGNAIGGDGGAAVSSIFDPTSSAISNLTDKDMSVGDKLLGVLPGIGGVKSSQAAKKRLKKFEEQKRKTDYFNNYLNTSNNDGVNINSLGGNLDSITDPININNLINEEHIKGLYKSDSNFLKDNFLKNLNYAKNQIKPQNKDVNINNWYDTNKPSFVIEDDTENKIDIQNNSSDKKKKFDLSKIDLSSLRYAPISMNAFQLATMGKPDVEKLDRLNNKYQKQYLDEKIYENIARQQATAASNAIGRSGVSTGQLINANLATQLNATKSISDAYNQIKRHNIDEEKLRQQTDFNNNQVNVSQSNAEKDINARNKGAFKTERSRLLSELGTSIGQIGKEELFKKYPKMMGMGYDWNGKYFQNQDGDIKTIEEAKALEEDSNKKNKGGFLSSDVTAHINKMYIARKRK